MGSGSCFLHSPLHHFLSLPPPTPTPTPTISSSSSTSAPFSLSSRPLFLYIRNADSKRRVSRPPMASLHRYLHPQDTASCKRRALLILGISIFPFLPWKNEAFEVYSVEDEQISGKEIQKSERTGQKSAPSSNPILSLLNAIGIIGSGVLVALYSLARNDKMKYEAIIESLNAQLKEKDAAIASLEKNFEVRLLYQQEEHNNILNKAKEEQLTSASRLELANRTIAGLGHQLQSEKRKIEGFQAQIRNLETTLVDAKTDKQVLVDEVNEKQSSIAVLHKKINVLTSEIEEKDEAIKSLNTSLTQKDYDLTTLDSTYKDTMDELDARTSEVASLRDELMKSHNELEQKNLVINDMSIRVNSMTIEQENLKAKLESLEHDYDDLRSLSDKKAASDAELLGVREHELAHLKEKYGFVVDEVNAKQAVISDLTEDRENLKRMFETALGSSRNEASDLNKQLNESKKLCSELEAALSKVESEYSQARESLQCSLNQATLWSEAISKELSSVNEALNKTENQLQVVSNELASTLEKHDKVQTELVDAYNKAEEATYEWKEEKKLVASLNNELEALEEQMLKDKEMRKSFDRDLEEATKSLDQISSNALILSKELEMSKTRISTLEEEREFLMNCLEREKEVAQEARENLEDGRSVVVELGIERESLAKRAKKLEHDLAFAKGEILRLRSKPNKETEPPIVVNSEADVKQEAVRKTRRRRE